MSINKVFILICFGVLILVAFPIMNSMFTVAGGLQNIVSNVTVGAPYATFENMLWGNFHWVIVGVALTGITIWAFKSRD